jgi:hypothetical protein
MGYYSTFDYDGEAKIDVKRVDELNKRIKEECLNGFSNAVIEANEDGNFSIELEDYYQKFYDDEIFANLLSEYITEGKIILYFTGEDNLRWCFTIYPNIVFDKSIEEFDKSDIEYIKQHKNIPEKEKKAILKDIKEYWQKLLLKAQENLKAAG